MPAKRTLTATHRNNGMSREKVSLTLPTDLLGRMDEGLEGTTENRASYIARLIREDQDRLDAPARPRAVVGMPLGAGV